MFQLMIFVPLVMLIMLVVLGLSLILSKKVKFNREKSSPFECGFDSNSNFRLPFSLRFFLITIIFLIFDVEIVMLLPAVFSLTKSVLLNWFKVFMLFTVILLLGLFHEWKQGALNWAL
ncbi:NADH dehydrogenase subunit 3 (mitochondrion) [Daphnia carinata]|uniref:NADH-ubiquinone oxidoreductase chain 3 n=1 Tax=Daphnia carinata TaxID=120202 RepID=A0A0N7CIK0_9CRUS|nr:NADH dehydrogenase subunit 3 [Daphnia carinata]AKL90611.1 NADH dehydrogenase subunit 3 [Daphnia carinata]